MTTNSVASKLGVDSGTELVIAACAHLTFMSNRDTFNRKEILEEMKSATAYYQENYSKNLSASLKRLVSNGELIERAKNVFALHSNIRKKLEVKLAE